MSDKRTSEWALQAQLEQEEQRVARLKRDIQLLQAQLDQAHRHNVRLTRMIELSPPATQVVLPAARWEWLRGQTPAPAAAATLPPAAAPDLPPAAAPDPAAKPEPTRWSQLELD